MVDGESDEASNDDDETALPEGDDPLVWTNWTTIQQSIASDPQRSAWVSANAGSGKTHVLTQRVIRLLLAGCAPSAILCLTYTKAAASEMSNRVFERLAEWAVLSDEELGQRIAQIEGAGRMQSSWRRHAGFLPRRWKRRAAEDPDHPCLLRSAAAPVSAGGECRRAFFGARRPRGGDAAVRCAALAADGDDAGEDRALAAAFSYVLNLGDESGLETLLQEIVANRNAIKAFTLAASSRAASTAFCGPSSASPTTIRRRHCRAILAAARPRRQRRLTLYIELADQKGGAKAQDVAAALKAVVTERDPLQRIPLLEKIFLTGKGEPKADSQFFVKAMLSEAPELADACRGAGACRILPGPAEDRPDVRRDAAALILADRLNRDYDDLKKQRSQLDFEDLITRTADLLTMSDVGPWIHYKLDQGIDHILVDEAQDTSPIQWSVIQSLAEDFFSGDSARSVVRTLFAVGDEKQSIYSFQGARPERFSEESRRDAATGVAERPGLFLRAAAAVVPIDLRRARGRRSHLHVRRRMPGA
jgi:ATP-dependent helicase/nuclease subunit A